MAVDGFRTADVGVVLVLASCRLATGIEGAAISIAAVADTTGADTIDTRIVDRTERAIVTGHCIGGPNAFGDITLFLKLTISTDHDISRLCPVLVTHIIELTVRRAEDFDDNTIEDVARAAQLWVAKLGGARVVILKAFLGVAYALPIDTRIVEGTDVFVIAFGVLVRIDASC